MRIQPTYKVMVDLGLIDTYPGLILPLIASATATLLFRQFFLTFGKADTVVTDRRARSFQLVRAN